MMWFLPSSMPENVLFLSLLLLAYAATHRAQIEHILVFSLQLPALRLEQLDFADLLLVLPQLLPSGKDWHLHAIGGTHA